MKKFSCYLLISTAFLLIGCATESSKTIETPTVAAAKTVYQGVKIPVAIGQFDNRSDYQNGIFSDGVDRLGSQAQTLLMSDLQQSGRFSVLDRTNMNAIKNEAQLKKVTQNIKGARYVITGDVTEFGRKTTGDHQLFGILGKGKSQA